MRGPHPRLLLLASLFGLEGKGRGRSTRKTDRAALYGSRSPRYPTHVSVNAKLPSPTDAEESLLEASPQSRPGLVTSIRRLRAEANLVRFPFFDLSRESHRAKRDVLEVRETKRGDDGLRIETVWTVERSVKSVFPGELARRLHREVVERTISELPRPVKNPICLGSFRDICAKLHIKIGGTAAKRIQSAFLSIVSATIHSKSTFFLKASKRYLQESFHLYEGVAFAGKPLPDGRTADAVYVTLAAWYIDNINANYVAPLDFEYLRKLRGSVASRMYELLHHWFFVAFRTTHAVVERRYSTICAYFPLARQDTLWKAKKQLRDAHKQHHGNGYLDCLPEWRAIQGTKDDWTIIYTPGQKARDEYRRNHSRRDQEGVAPDELPAGSQPLLPLRIASEPCPDELRRDLARELEVLGISHGVAIDLVKNHEPPYLQRKIEAFQWMMAKPEHPFSNPAGYLRESIEKDYASPSGFISREERTQKAAEEAAALEAQRKTEASARKVEEQRQAEIEARWAALSESERAALREQVRAGLNEFALRRLQEEEREGRRGVGHATLEAEIHKLLAADATGSEHS